MPKGWLIGVMVELADEPAAVRHFFAAGLEDRATAEWRSIDGALRLGPVAPSPVGGGVDQLGKGLAGLLVGGRVPACGDGVDDGQGPGVVELGDAAEWLNARLGEDRPEHLQSLQDRGAVDRHDRREVHVPFHRLSPREAA